MRARRRACRHRDRGGPLRQILAVLRDHHAGVHTLNASYKKSLCGGLPEARDGGHSRGIQDGSIPSDIRYLDPNFSHMEGGIPVIWKKWWWLAVWGRRCPTAVRRTSGPHRSLLVLQH